MAVCNLLYETVSIATVLFGCELWAPDEKEIEKNLTFPETGQQMLLKGLTHPPTLFHASTASVVLISVLVNM